MPGMRITQERAQLALDVDPPPTKLPRQKKEEKIARQDAWVALWHGPAFPQGGNRSVWWTARKQDHESAIAAADRLRLTKNGALVAAASGMPDVSASANSSGTHVSAHGGDDARQGSALARFSTITEPVQPSSDVFAVRGYELRIPMRVSEAWLGSNLPGVSFATNRPTVSASGGHAHRLVRATALTPRGTARHASAEVTYTLPPAGGDDPTARSRRSSNHGHRDSNVCRRLGDYLLGQLYYLAKSQSCPPANILEPTAGRVSRTTSSRKRKIKSEEQLPPMPASARVKLEEEVPPMPSDACVKLEYEG